MPYVPFFVGPDIDGTAVTNQLEQAGLADVRGGPLIEVLQPWRDHGVVEQPAKASFVGDVPLDVM